MNAHSLNMFYFALLILTPTSMEPGDKKTVTTLARYMEQVKLELQAV